MAGDWMKIEKVTPDKPEVLAMAGTLDLDPDTVFGKLFRVWRWFDDHTENGNAVSVTKNMLDRIASVSGFADAMAIVGWLDVNEKGVYLPNFDRHNGQTSKRRALTAKRVAKHKGKTNAQGNAPVTQSVTHRALPREEKRREEYSDCSDRTSNQGSNPSEKSKPAGSGSSDRLPIASSSLEITASKIFRKCEYTGSDGGIFWQAAALVHKAAISEDELWDACEAARLCGKNKPAYFRKSLSNALTKREIDLSASLKLFRITPSLPKSAPEDAL